MREATQTVSSWERKLFIIGHSPVAIVFRRKPHIWIEDVTLTTAGSLARRIVSADRDYRGHHAPPSFNICGAFLQTDELHPKLGSKQGRFPQAPLLCFWTVPA